jgi:hypothetical protein
VKGANPEEDAALKEIVAAVEQDTGKQVELVLYDDGDELPDAIEAALETGRPPDLAFGLRTADYGFRRSARRPHRHGRPLLRPVRSGCARLVDAAQRKDRTEGALYELTVGRTTNHVHVWKSLLERAGFTLGSRTAVGFGSGTDFHATWPPCLVLRMKPPKPQESGRTRL